VTSSVAIDQPIRIEIEYDVLRDGVQNTSQVHLKDENGVFVFSSGNAPSMCERVDSSYGKPMSRGRYLSVCEVPANFLNDSRYVVSVFLGPEIGRPTVSSEAVLVFSVADTGAMRKEYLGSWYGPVIRPRLSWSTELVD
jgi:lipopolysaccharide transport system ATP-binding protein